MQRTTKFRIKYALSILIYFFLMKLKRGFIFLILYIHSENGAAETTGCLASVSYGAKLEAGLDII